jgi:hypothetical protein
LMGRWRHLHSRRTKFKFKHGQIWWRHLLLPFLKSRSILMLYPNNIMTIQMTSCLLDHAKFVLHVFQMA